MKANIEEIFLTPTGAAARVLLEKPLHCLPGQYFLADSPFNHQVLPLVLFSASATLASRQLDLAAPIPATWRPGDEITLSAPMGKGFAIPDDARALAFAVLDGDAQRLLPLMQKALALNAAVALFCAGALVLPGLPPAIEIYPLESLPEAFGWADFYGVDTSHEKFEQLRTLLKTPLIARSDNLRGQVLIRTSMPCSGRGDCGVCAIKTKSGWRNICEDGPVFPLQEVLDVAG